jgi:hypothetical protein
LKKLFKNEDMKKITKNDLKGLMEMFPVYNEDVMRKVVGGLTIGEMEAQLMEALGNTGYGFTDNYGNYLWFRSYDAFSSSHSSFLSFGYVNFASPGYFYFSDGNGGYIGYYNSVFGFGTHEVIPQANLCFFEGLALITGKSLASIFTEYKRAGNAYTPTRGVFLSEAASFLLRIGRGSPVNFSQIDLQTAYYDKKRILAFGIISDNGYQNQSLHAYEIISELSNDVYLAQDATSKQYRSFHKSYFKETAFYINTHDLYV